MSSFFNSEHQQVQAYQTCQYLNMFPLIVEQITEILEDCVEGGFLDAIIYN